MENEIIQYGSVIAGLLAIITLIIRELFAFLKTKNNGSGLNSQILRELQVMNQNHLHSLQEAINSGNDRLIDTIHKDNTKIIEALGEIKGALRR